MRALEAQIVLFESLSWPSRQKCPVVLLTQPVTAPLAAPLYGHFYEKNVMKDGQGSKTFGILLLANSALQEEFAFPWKGIRGNNQVYNHSREKVQETELKMGRMTSSPFPLPAFLHSLCDKGHLCL